MLISKSIKSIKECVENEKFMFARERCLTANWDSQQKAGDQEIESHQFAVEIFQSAGQGGF